jgi:uncharacterized membrane protein
MQRRSAPPSPASDNDRSGSINRTLERNIRVLVRRRQAEEERARLEEKISARIAAFTGSMTFVYIHAAVYGVWIVLNLGWLPGVTPFDPTFVVLAMVASVEAIFLSTFVLINQNRLARTDERRADLDLQISLLTEHELTRLAILLKKVADRLEVATEVDDEIAEVTRDVKPEAVLDEIETIAPQ